MARILVVDDSPTETHQMVNTLAREGHQVLTAATGTDGISLASAEQPDIILMDLSLPVMDGWTATRKIKADDNLKHIPVIALSAHAMAEHKKSALESGCDDYDTKPVDMSRLIEKINQALET